MAAGRGRKTGVVLIVLVVALVGLFVIADRVAAYAAERTVAKQARTQLASRQVTMPTDPKVTVGGFPFLTQVVRGVYDKVTIDLTNPGIQGVTLQELDVTARGVHASTSTIMNGTGTVTADHVDGIAKIGWDQVPHLLDQAGVSGTNVQVSGNDADQIVVTEPVTLGGISVTVVATGSLVVSGTEVSFKVSKVDVQGQNVPAFVRELANKVGTAITGQIKIPALPYNLRVQSVQTAPSGLTVTAVALNVPLSG
jgi:hypothetical protein